MRQGIDRGGALKPTIVPVNPGQDGGGGASLNAELGAMPLAFGTAHNLLVRARVGDGSRVLVLFAGEAAGYAAVRLAITHGALVTGQCPEAAAPLVRAAGAEHLGMGHAPGPGTYDAVIDISRSSGWRSALSALRPGGVYATPGVIADPLRRDERREVHLNDLTLFGRPHLPREVFAGLVTTVTRAHLHLLSASPLRSVPNA